MTQLAPAPMQMAVENDGTTAADAARRRRLRRMRTLAGALLVFAAIVYAVTLHDDGFWGFVNAGAEASMVGAIADWFAVTALFRHPLGLPIPHTALVPRRKDEFGRSLQDFFTENFLAEDVIRERLAVADIPRRIGAWLAVPDNAARVVAESATVAAIGVQRLRDEDVTALVDEVLLPRLREAGPVTLDLMHRDGRVGARWLALHPREFALIWRLAECPGAPVTRPELLRDVERLRHEPETNSVQVHVSRLRSKLAAHGLGSLVATDPAGGYRLAAG